MLQQLHVVNASSDTLEGLSGQSAANTDLGGDAQLMFAVASDTDTAGFVFASDTPGDQVTASLNLAEQQLTVSGGVLRVRGIDVGKCAASVAAKRLRLAQLSPPSPPP